MTILGLAVSTTDLSAQTPYQIVRERVHPSQLATFDRLPLESLFKKAGFSSSESMPRLFERLKQGEGSVSVRQSRHEASFNRVVFVTVYGHLGSTQLNMAFDSETGYLISWHFSSPTTDPWKRNGWNRSEAQARDIASAFANPNFPLSSTLRIRSTIPKVQSIDESVSRSTWLFVLDWELDGRHVGGMQTASAEVEESSGALLSYYGIVGEIQRRPLLPDELEESRTYLVQRLVDRFGNGSYTLGTRNLIYAPMGDRWMFVPKWELLCTELNHLGRRSAFIQIVMDPDTKAVLHETRSVGGFGAALPDSGLKTPGQWQFEGSEGQIKATDRKATEGGVQRTLTSGNRLLVGTFFAAERLLEVKGVFFEVDPALSEALAKAQP